MFTRIFNSIKQRLHLPLYKDWSKKYNFQESWKERISLMRSYIPDNSSVMDLGCGQMWLKDMLSPSCDYIPVDYVKRGENCLVCDFNKGEFPNKTVDVVFASGVFEYVKNPAAFAKKMVSVAGGGGSIIMSYCTTDEITNMRSRYNATWKNHLSKNDILQMFCGLGMGLKHFQIHKGNSIFVFSKQMEH